MGCTRKIVAGISREIILSIYLPSMRHVRCLGGRKAVMYWSKPSAGHQDHLVLEHMMHEERLRDLDFLSLKKRGLSGYLMVVSSYLIEGNRENKGLFRGAQ